jgi:hypothetical protein
MSDAVEIFMLIGAAMTIGYLIGLNHGGNIG